MVVEVLLRFLLQLSTTFFYHICCLAERIINIIFLRIYFKPVKKLDVLYCSCQEDVEFFLYFLPRLSPVSVEEPYPLVIVVFCIKFYPEVLFVDLYSIASTLNSSSWEQLSIMEEYVRGLGSSSRSASSEDLSWISIEVGLLVAYLARGNFEERSKLWV